MPFVSGTGIAILVVLLIIGVPVPLCFGSAMVFMVYAGGYNPAMALQFSFFKIDSMILLAMPLFIMAGGIMAEGGIGHRLVAFVDVFTERIKGGLGVAGTVACGVFGAISGSAAAALSAIGSIMFPEMKKRGYPGGHVAALMSCASVLALLIPPSIDMVLFGWLSYQSIAACFLATVGPGLITIAALSLVNLFLLRKAPLATSARMSAKETLVEVGRKGKGAVWALLMPFVVLGGIYGGIFTPTEAAAVSVIYAIPVALLIYKGLDLRGFGRNLVGTATTSGAVMMMLFFALVLSQMFIRENLPSQIVAAITAVSDNKYVILLMVNMFLIFIGMIMDDVSGITLSTPLLLPLMKKIGVHPIQFAAIIGTNLGMGNVTPPTAPLLYLSGRVAGVDTKDMLKPALIFIVFGMMPGVLLATYWPALSLWLPRVLGYIK